MTRTQFPAFRLPRVGLLLALSAAVPAHLSLAKPVGIPPVNVTPFEIPEGVDPDSPVGSLRYRGAVLIVSTDADRPFYGLSGFWVSPDGSRFAGTEQGNWVEGALAYDANGRLNGLSIAETGALLDESGQAFTDDLDRDAESLDHDGTHYVVGFEGNIRVLRYKDFQSRAVPVPLPPEALAEIAEGSGFSSVVHLSGGRLIALPEFTSLPRTPGWMVTPEAEGEIRLRAPGDWWLPVSLSRFANDDLLVLEIYQGPETQTINVTRLGRIPAGEIAIGGSMNPVEIATLQPPWTEVRFEGSAVRTGSEGEELIYVIQNAAPSVLFMFEFVD
jgi:hypothetical protein